MSLNETKLEQEITCGIRSWGDINKFNLVSNIHEHQPKYSYYDGDEFNVQFNCELCLESFILEYKQESETDNSMFEVYLKSANNEVITSLLVNIESSGFVVHEHEALIKFNNLNSTQIFISLYNDILDGLEQEKNGSEEA